MIKLWKDLAESKSVDQHIIHALKACGPLISQTELCIYIVFIGFMLHLALSLFAWIMEMRQPLLSTLGVHETYGAPHRYIKAHLWLDTSLV